MADDKKIIFSMVGVSKSFQNNKQVLKDIYLSFFYGAKIGIIGLNGSGKSTLMKIIAGIEKNYQGEVVFSPGYSVGYLAQEPQLDDTKTVKEVVMEGVQQVVDTLAEYEEINQKFGLPEYYEDPEKMDALFARQAELQDIIDATDAWNLDSNTPASWARTSAAGMRQGVRNEKQRRLFRLSSHHQFSVFRAGAAVLYVPDAPGLSGGFSDGGAGLRYSSERPESGAVCRHGASPYGGACRASEPGV